MAYEHMPVDIAVVELGGNDAVPFWEPTRISAKTFRDVMMQLVIRLRGDGVQRVQILTTIPNPQASEVIQSRLMAYRLALLSVYWPARVRVVDIWRRLDPEEDYEGSNPHPNAGGHWKIAYAVEQAILRPGKPWWGYV
jgi:hypothetical protein